MNKEKRRRRKSKKKLFHNWSIFTTRINSIDSSSRRKSQKFPSRINPITRTMYKGEGNLSRNRLYENSPTNEKKEKPVRFNENGTLNANVEETRISINVGKCIWNRATPPPGYILLENTLPPFSSAPFLSVPRIRLGVWQFLYLSRYTRSTYRLK